MERAEVVNSPDMSPRPRFEMSRHDAHIRLEDELWAQLGELAQKLGVSRTAALGLVVRSGFGVVGEGSAAGRAGACPLCGAELGRRQ